MSTSGISTLTTSLLSTSRMQRGCSTQSTASEIHSATHPVRSEVPPAELAARLHRRARNLYQDWCVADTRRRPRWRCDRRAVLLRLAADVAVQLVKGAEVLHLSRSETAIKFISTGLGSSRAKDGVQ